MKEKRCYFALILTSTAEADKDKTYLLPDRNHHHHCKRRTPPLRGSLVPVCVSSLKPTDPDTSFQDSMKFDVNAQLFCEHIRWRSRWLSGFRVHSSIANSEASVLIDQATKSAQELVAEPPATVELGLSVSLCALKPWLVRPARV